MIYIFSGEDTYRMREKIQDLVGEYKKENGSGINLRFLDGKKMEFEELKNEVFGLSFFSERKLIIIEDAFLNKKFKEDFKTKGKDFLETDNIIVFFQQGKVLKSDILYAFLRKKSEVQEFDLLKEADLRKWALDSIKKFGGEIDSSSLDLLLQYVGNDLWRLNNEIQKLISFDKRITKENVDRLINSQFQLNIFNTIDAIAEKDKSRAIRLIKEHERKGESIFGILAMIANQFKNMMIVKSAPDYRKTSLHPFVARKSYYQSQKFSMEDLKRVYQEIMMIDMRLKTGGQDESIALETLILSI